MIDKSKVKKILVITLSNIGDAVLTTPVIDVLKKEIPAAGISVLVGPRAKEVFDDDPRIDEIIVYDKTMGFVQKVGLAFGLRRKKFDMLIDLRNTLFRFIIGPRYHTPLFRSCPRKVRHMRRRHLWRLEVIGLKIEAAAPYVYIDKKKEVSADTKLCRHGISLDEDFIAIAPGGRSMTKLWPAENFRELSGRIVSEMGRRIVLVGDEADMEIAGMIAEGMNGRVINLCGMTDIKELARILKAARLSVSNDSAASHIADSVGTPVIALFGPTDYRKYRPLGKGSVVIHKEMECLPCERSLCRKERRDCMEGITVEEVFEAVKGAL